MILRNHGLLTCGETIGEAFILMYYLDKTCKNQLDTMSTGKPIIVPSDNIMEYAAGQYEDPRFRLGIHEWPALLRLLDQKIVFIKINYINIFLNNLILNKFLHVLYSILANAYYQKED